MTGGGPEESTDIRTPLPFERPPELAADVPAPLGKRLATIALWIVIALPAIYQIGLLATAIAGRAGYPYDLEWMEGGMLHHALRIRNGEGIYVPPSIDFIPYLYTPLYPTLLALFGGAFGVSYTVGRMFSIIALVGMAGIAFVSLTSRRHQHVSRAPAYTGVALSLGLFCAYYPYVEGWYDLVRADTLFLFMITGGIAALPRWATTRTGLAGHGQIAAGAFIMALAFFCKQTGVLYVGFGGLVVAVLAPRRAFTYIVVAGAIGLGGTWMLDTATHGWFWIYVEKIHRAHDFNYDRFYKSFGNILWHFPALTIVVVLALVLVAATAVVTWLLQRRHDEVALTLPLIPRGTHPLLLWSATFAMSTVVGAIGWGTEFAHFNAYMPAFLHGALAAGAAIPATAACVRRLWGGRGWAELVVNASAAIAAVPLAYVCWTARWEPSKFMPTPSDVAAGERLIARIRAIEGDVWMPSHPWYLHLAGKTPHVHRMGIKDVTTRQTRAVDGLDDALQKHAFAAIVLDDHDLQLELPQLHQYYRPALLLPADERPRVYTGAHVVPDTVWVPAVRAAPPPGARAVFDFEAATWGEGWTRSGSAWGNGPTAEPLPGQGLVLGATGMRFATSMHGGDTAIGRVTSPVFTVDGARLTLELGGGTDATKLRVELWVDGTIVRTATVPEPGGSTLHLVAVDVAAFAGKQAHLVLVDDATTGHLDVDDVWLWQTAP